MTQLPQGTARAARPHMKLSRWGKVTRMVTTAFELTHPMWGLPTNGGTSGRACLVGVEGVILRELGPGNRSLHQDAQPPRLQPACSRVWHIA